MHRLFSRGLNLFYFIFIVYVQCLARPERVLDPQEVESQAVLSCLKGAGN